MLEIIPQIIANSIIAGSIYFIMSAGFNLIFGVAKFFDIGYGGFAAIGGFLFFTFVNYFGVPMWLAVILSMIISGIISYFLEKFCYSKLRARKASNTVLLIASLGVITVIQAIIAMIFTSEFKSLSTGDVSTFSFGTAIITSNQLWILASAVLIFVFLEILIHKTLFGRAVSAINDSEEVAKIVGINTERVVGRIFMLSGGIAALGGILVGLDTGIEPRMGFELLLKGAIAAIVGGLGSISGGFLGAYLLGFVENFGILNLSSEWKDAIAFGLLIIFLLFRPSGIIKRKQ